MIEDTKLRQLAKTVFSTPKLTVFDAFVSCTGGVLLFTGHWLAAIPTVIVGYILGRLADHLSWS